MMSKYLVSSLQSINRSSSLINLRKFHSIRTASQSCFNHFQQSSTNENVDQFKLKSNLLNNSKNGKLNLFMIQNRFNSTEKSKTIADAHKSSVESIKQSDQQEIDLSDFKIPDIPSPDEILALKGSLSATDIGLTYYLPPGLLYKLFDSINKMGVDWPVTIIASTILVRTLVFPMMISSRKRTIELSNFMTKFKKFNEEVENAQMRGNLMDVNKIVLKHQDIIDSEESKKIIHGSKLAHFKMPLIQLFLFTSFFISLRKMSYYPVPSLHECSFLWLPSLAERDPYYILPIITSTTLYFTLRMGFEFGNVNAAMGKVQKIMFNIMPIGSLILTYNFPSALCLYWCTANLHSLLTTYLLSFEKVRNYFELPKQTHPQQETKLKLSSIIKLKNAVSSVKDSYKDHKVKSNIKSMDQTDRKEFEKAGSGPLRKTYKYNPLKQKPGL